MQSSHCNYTQRRWTTTTTHSCSTVLKQRRSSNTASAHSSLKLPQKRQEMTSSSYRDGSSTMTRVSRTSSQTDVSRSLKLPHVQYHLLQHKQSTINPITGTGNYSTTSNNMKVVHWLLIGGLLHLVQQGEDWAGPQPAEAPPRCTKCNIPPINRQCTITVLLYNGPLLCGFNEPIKGLTSLTT